MHPAREEVKHSSHPSEGLNTLSKMLSIQVPGRSGRTSRGGTGQTLPKGEPSTWGIWSPA